MFIASRTYVRSSMNIGSFFSPLFVDRIQVKSKRTSPCWAKSSVCYYAASGDCLLAAASVAAHELVDATSGVDQLALTRVEGV